MTANSARSRKNDPEGFQGRVLDAAAELFQQQGYHATSMQEVMTEAGASGGALHHHFPSKKSLALAVITQRVGPAVRETWIDPLHTAPTLGKGIANVFAAIVEGMDARGVVSGCPLNNLALELAFADADFRTAIDEIFTEWKLALAELIGSTQGGARLDRARRMEAASFIVSAYSGAMTMAKSSQTSAPLSSVAKLLARWLREQEFAA